MHGENLCECKEMLVVKKVERMLGALGETPFKPLKEKQQEGIYNDIMIEK